MANIKEDRIKAVAISYYSRSDIKKNMFEFSKNRECIPRYFDNFGKRPNAFQYESDIFELAKTGWSSFHCSEEIWQDPLEISTEFSEQDYNEIRLGWDLIIDIDCKWVEYSKLAAKAIIQSLEFCGVKNIGVKFSGSKGFHLIVPWKAFPEEIYGQKTKDMFPEWPRAICEYIKEISNPNLEREIEKEDSKFIFNLEKDMRCETCKNFAQQSFQITVQCPSCKREEIFEIVSDENKKRKCPDCKIEFINKGRVPIYRCSKCNKDSLEEPKNFKDRIDIFNILGIDVALVSPRHLFRMPYSLHEKTALASVVIDKDKISEFNVQDANPLRAKVKNFTPDSKPDEAKQLLLQALDWHKQKEIEEEKEEENKPKQSKGKTPKQYQQVTIQNLTENLYPPCIANILQGIKQDGRKRALFVLINYFKAVGLQEEEIEKRITEWNKLNHQPLKKGYINAQLGWFAKRKPMMPPNCDKPHYKDMAVCKADQLCKIIKNPVNYTMKKYFGLGKTTPKK